MAKPKFDPNQPYQEANAKPKFDPSQSFETLEENELSLEQPSLFGRAARGVVDAGVWAGQKFDSVTGAPTRAALDASLDGKSPLSAFASQFGADTKTAPTGKSIAVKAGISPERPLIMTAQQQQAHDERYNPNVAQLEKMKGGYQDLHRFSDADIAGLGIDVGADPTNIIPGAALAKGIAKGTVTAAKTTGRLAKSASELSGLTGAASRAAGRAGEAVKSTSLGAIAADTATNAKRAMDQFFKPKQAEDFAHWSGVAERNGIDINIIPESVQYGQSSVISGMARHNRQNVLTGEHLRESFNNGLVQVDGAIDNEVAKLSGGMPLNSVEAGDVIRRSYDQAVEDLFDSVDFTYSGVINQAPGIRLTAASEAALAPKLAGIEKFAKGRVLRGITKTDKEQGHQILQAVQNIRAGNGSLKHVHEAMADLGRYAFKKSKGNAADIPVDQKKFRDMYFALREEFINSTAAQLGPDVANGLIDSNNQIDMFLKNKAPIANLLDAKDVAPEKLFRALVSHGDTTKLSALKEMLTPEQFNALRGSYVEGLITRNSDGVIEFRNLRNKLQKNSTILSVLFEPEELQNLGDLAQLGEKWGPAILNPSGTEVSSLLRNPIEGIRAGLTGQATLDLLKKKAARPAPRIAEDFEVPLGGEFGGRAYHGTYADFVPEQIQPSKKGRYGPGYYLVLDKDEATNYGSKVHEFNIKSSRLFDVSENGVGGPVSAFAEKYGLDLSKAEKKSGEQVFGELLMQLRNRFPDEDLIGTGAVDKLHSLLREEGFEGIKFNQNTSKNNVVLFDRSNFKTSGEMKTLLGARVPSPLLPPGQSSFQRPTRGNAETSAKYLQMLGAIEASRQNENDSAGKRRMEALIKQRLGQ